MGEPQENNRQLTTRELLQMERERRQGVFRMRASPPAGTGFIGFVPDAPPGYEPLVSPFGETTPSPKGEQPARADGAGPHR